MVIICSPSRRIPEIAQYNLGSLDKVCAGYKSIWDDAGEAIYAEVTAVQSVTSSRGVQGKQCIEGAIPVTPLLGYALLELGTMGICPESGKEIPPVPSADKTSCYLAKNHSCGPPVFTIIRGGAGEGRFKVQSPYFCKLWLSTTYSIFLLPSVRTSTGQGSWPGGETQITITKESESCLFRCYSFLNLY